MKTNFKNNLKNLSICNDGFSINPEGFWYKKQGSKSKEGFSWRTTESPSLPLEDIPNKEQWLGPIMARGSSY